MTLKKITMLTLLSLLLACAQRPEQELEDTRRALDEARAAEAAVYAPEEFEAAEEALRQAEREIETQDDRFALRRSYDRASELLSQARTAAQEAVSAAAANKENVSKQAQEAIGEAEEVVETAADALTRAPRGKGTAADLEAMQSSLEASRESLSQARQHFEEERFLDALNEAKSAAERAGTITRDIEEAIRRTGRR
ncbi:MAG TPA: hypothetical protein VKZ59_15280 [Acidobacteriota bacterium]|nr:hypothetical protein [Acidobacteriota bacterium]